MASMMDQFVTDVIGAYFLTIAHGAGHQNLHAKCLLKVNEDYIEGTLI